MSGGKGGSTSSKVEIPKWLEEPSKRAIARGEDMAQIGYQPWMGPDVAAFNATQNAAFDNTNNAAGAFGLSQGSSGMPQPMDYNGFAGYSGYPIFDQARTDYEQANPQQAAAYDALFGDYGVGIGTLAPVPTASASNPYSFSSDGGGNWRGRDNPGAPTTPENDGTGFSFSRGNLGLGGLDTGGGW